MVHAMIFMVRKLQNVFEILEVMFIVQPTEQS